MKLVLVPSLYIRRKRGACTSLLVPDRYKNNIIDISQQHLPFKQVWAFGSRVTAEASGGSDLLSPDGEALPLGRAREAFRDSNLPFTVELLDWAITIPEHFRSETKELRGGAIGKSEP